MNSKKDRVRKLLSCPSCGYGKTRKTHSYGVYKVYVSGTNLVLRCNTCGAVVKYRFIEGGAVPDQEDQK